MATETVPARTPERQAFYDRILPYHLAPLWETLHSLVTQEPQTVGHLGSERQSQVSISAAGGMVVDADPVELGLELWQGIRFRLARTPVIVGRQ